MVWLVGGILVRRRQREGAVEVGVELRGRGVPSIEAHIIDGLLELGGAATLPAVWLSATVQWLARVERLGGEGGIRGVRGGMRGVEAIQIDPEDVGTERMRGGGVMSSPSNSVAPTPVEALPQSRSGPTAAPDVDLTELANQILQLGQEHWVVHVQLLVLLLVFVFLSFQCIMPEARVTVQMSALVVPRAGAGAWAQAGARGDTVILPPPVSVSLSLSVALHSSWIRNGVCVSVYGRER